MRGKNCIVTGANSGVGKAMATELARRGANVVMVSRDAEKGRQAAADVEKTATGDVSVEVADLSLVRDVRSLAARLAARLPRVDVLMNNAGIYLPTRVVTDEGLEFSFAVNHLAPFVLTNLLRERLAAAGGARVVTTGSMAYITAKLDLDDLGMEKKWRPLRHYANTKLAALVLTSEVARRFGAEGIVANTYHPGGVRSGMAQDAPNFMGTMMWALGPFLRTPAKGAETGLYLATEAGLESSGGFFVDRKAQTLRGAAADEALASHLWAKSAEIAGISSEHEPARPNTV